MFLYEAVLSVLSIYGGLPLCWSNLVRLAPDLGATWLILSWMESVHRFAFAVAGDFVCQAVYVFLGSLLWRWALLLHLLLGLSLLESKLDILTDSLTAHFNSHTFVNSHAWILISGSIWTVIPRFPVRLWASWGSCGSLVIMPMAFLFHLLLEFGLLLLDLLVALEGVNSYKVFDVVGFHGLLDHVTRVLFANLFHAFNHTFRVFRVCNSARFTFGSPEEARECSLGGHAVSRLHRGSALQLGCAQFGLRSARLLGLGLGAVCFSRKNYQVVHLIRLFPPSWLDIITFSLCLLY